MYSLTAQCSQASEILKTKSAVLKDLMDKDLIMGYALQARISMVYFERHIETMQKLQGIVMNSRSSRTDALLRSLACPVVWRDSLSFR